MFVISPFYMSLTFPLLKLLHALEYLTSKEFLSIEVAFCLYIAF